MNTHKKLLEIGFRKCEFLRLESTRSKVDGNIRYYNKMVPDDTFTETNRIGGKYVTTVKKRIHLKKNSFYQMQFNDLIKIWILLENNVIARVYMEKDSEAKEITNGKFYIGSKGDIFKLFPKEMQRDFIISSLFG